MLWLLNGASDEKAVIWIDKRVVQKKIQQWVEFRRDWKLEMFSAKKFIKNYKVVGYLPLLRKNIFSQLVFCYPTVNTYMALQYIGALRKTKRFYVNLEQYIFAISVYIRKA